MWHAIVESGLESPSAGGRCVTTLVTGATGFVGRHLVRRLLQRDPGARVRVLTRDPRRVPLDWRGAVEIVVGDLAEMPRLHAAVTGAEVVYHLAGELRDEGRCEAVNHIGTRNLLQACVEAGALRVLHYSSVGVIGARTAGRFDEESPCSPRTAYECSKLRGELASREYCREQGLPVIVVRPTIVFGPREVRSDSFLAWMQAIHRGRFRLIGSKPAIANYVYVDDVVESCLRLTQDESAIGRTFHIADPCTVKELSEWAAQLLGARRPRSIPRYLAMTAAVGLEMAARVTGMRPVLTVNQVRALTSRCLFVPDKLRRKFDVVVGWREGLRRTLLGYQSLGLFS
jgi:nucleoside-diphosphate-sugar epimerase